MPAKATIARREMLMGAAGLGFLSTTPCQARAASTGRYPAVRASVDQVIAEPAASGAIVAIGRAGAPTTFVSRGTLALGNSTRVNEHTLFRIYSMTKPVIGMAVMLLVAEGRIKLDQPVADFIPGFAKLRVLTDPANSLESRPATSVMTIRHLLTHTAGLGSSPVSPALEAEYKRLGLSQNLRDHAASPAQTAPVTNLADFADHLATAPLQSDPGRVWSYSVGFDLLGWIIELAGGLPLEQFLKQRLFKPLGMAHTSFTVPSSQANRLVTSYAGRGSKLAPVDAGPRSIFLNKPAFPSGGGGLVSSAYDYDRFLAMLANQGSLHGTMVMPPSAVAMGTSNLLPDGVDMRRYVGIPGVVGFGAGGCIADNGGFKGVFGWMGAAGTIGVVVPSERLRLTGLINNFTVFDFAVGLPKALHTDLV